jgi:hypothetical protein
MALAACREALSSVKTQYAWLELKDEEQRTGDSPVLTTNTDLTADLMNAEARFLAMMLEVQALLNSAKQASSSKRKGEAARRELDKLRREFIQTKHTKGF